MCPPSTAILRQSLNQRRRGSDRRCCQVARRDRVLLLSSPGTEVAVTISPAWSILNFPNISSYATCGHTQPQQSPQPPTHGQLTSPAHGSKEHGAPLSGGHSKHPSSDRELPLRLSRSDCRCGCRPRNRPKPRSRSGGSCP